ncbi:MAG TPA: hypothetical protein VN982_01670 [Candidatus Dormibacteraeota bacterium]|nr:hypothetical protein [Candidatus Dormibacteraeota bacterium]
MYPDLRDVERVMPKLSGVPRPEPLSVWESVVLARSFIEECHGRCRNHGRHHFISASSLKTEAEQFIGRPISDYAFMAALLMGRLTTRPLVIDPKQFEKLEVKFPPTDRFKEARNSWNEHQLRLELEIKHEREEIARRKAISEQSLKS